MFTATDVVLGGILPAVVAAAFMGAARRFGWRPATAWAVSVPAGYIVGQVGLAARAGVGQAMDHMIWPRVAHDWLPILIASAAVIGFIAGTGRRQVAVVLAVAACAAAPMLFLWRSIYVQNEWSGIETVAWISLLALALLVIWTLLAAARADSQPFVRATLMIFIALGTAGVLGMSGSFSYAQLAGAMAAALVGAKLAALRGAYLHGLNGSAGVVAVSLGSLLALGHFYANLSAWNAVLLAAALVAGGGWLPVDRLPSRSWQIGLRMLACLVPLAAAVALAYRAFAAAI